MCANLGLNTENYHNFLLLHLHRRLSSLSAGLIAISCMSTGVGVVNPPLSPASGRARKFVEDPSRDSHPDKSAPLFNSSSLRASIIRPHFLHAPSFFILFFRRTDPPIDKLRRDTRRGSAPLTYFYHVRRSRSYQRGSSTRGFSRGILPFALFARPLAFL